MYKLAIFVEGYTEVLFVNKLIEEIANKNEIIIEQISIRGGATVPRKSSIIQAAKPATTEQFYFLIIDCGGDNLVKQRISEEHAGLSSNGYQSIIGLRDVRPNFTRAEIGKLELGLRYGIKTSLIPVDFILAIMEIEAWFLAEQTHFGRINPLLNSSSIITTHGFDIENDDLSLRDFPTQDLSACYSIVGLKYIKNSNLTINSLDFESIYFDLSTKIPYLKKLINLIEDFITPGAQTQT